MYSAPPRKTRISASNPWAGGTAETLRFYAPRNEAHVSHSAVNLQRTDRFFEAQVSTVRELAKKLDDTDIEIIKMDIEGAEYAVLSSLMDQGPLPSTLCGVRPTGKHLQDDRGRSRLAPTRILTAAHRRVELHLHPRLSRLSRARVPGRGRYDSERHSERG